VSLLVVITGPIASGKSTIAASLAAELRRGGWQVAELDLDGVVEASGPWTDLSHERFRRAQIVFGKLVGGWLAQGFNVIAHGPLFEPLALDDLLDSAPEGTEVRHVRLLATYETALQRVNDDPERGRSKDARFLRRAYERSAPLLAKLPQANWEFDTSTRSCRAIVDELTAALHG
jgi:hypothetical protein